MIFRAYTVYKNIFYFRYKKMMNFPKMLATNALNC
jgi:hypothetical protein